MLGELSGSIVHELGQPLTAILSNAQAAQRFVARPQPDLNEVRDILADIVADDQRAVEVIRRLRQLLKRGEVHFQPISANEIVEDVLKLLRSELIDRGVTARTELASSLPILQGDRVGTPAGVDQPGHERLRCDGRHAERGSRSDDSHRTGRQ